MTTPPKTKKRLPRVGWYEWVSLPDLGLPPILAKVDTGAKTSALHAFRVDYFEKNGIKKVSFGIHPHKHSNRAVTCEAEVLDYRQVTDSGGHTEARCVIKTTLLLGETAWPIEITLTNRDNMAFRMLLGRSALKHRFLVNPAKKCLLSKKIKKKDLS